MSSRGKVWSTIEIVFAQANKNRFLIHQLFRWTSKGISSEPSLTVKVSRTAANLFVDTIIGFGCIERLPNAHRCLIEMAGPTFWYMRITINLQTEAGNKRVHEWCVEGRMEG